MNRLMIIGNCTKDPEIRSTQTGKTVCTFTVAVNNRKKKADGQTDTEYFRVSAWDALGENCGKYISKGKKVAVVGAVSVHAYTTQKGEPGASLEVLANEVEFLSAKETELKDKATGYTRVDMEVPY